MTTFPIVIQPPSFRVTNAGGSGKSWFAEVAFDTPKGPASIRVDVALPETMRALMAELVPATLIRAATKYLAMAQQKQAVAAGFLGVKLPNPAKMIKRGAAKLAKKARKAVKAAVSKLPGPVQRLAGPLLEAVANAANPLALVNAAKEATQKLGKIKIPGLGVPVMALHPLGAAALFSSKVLGNEATNQLISEAVETVETAAEDEEIRDAIGVATAKKVVKIAAKKMASDADFARELGIPTIKVAPELRDGARMIVGILKGVYAKSPEAIKALQTLSKKASSGDMKAKMLWTLAVQISDAARGVKVGYSVGDGFGPGYGVSGYQPQRYSPVLALAAMVWGCERARPLSSHNLD